VENVPIAIVGMSCRFAGAANPGAFWRMIMNGGRALTPLAPEAALAPGARNVFDRPYPTHGGQLGPLYACVPTEQNFPRQINAGENQDLYFAVQLAFDALADAGMRPHTSEKVRGTVRFGYASPFNASTVNWLEHTFFVDQTMEILGRFFPHAPAEALDQVRGRLVDSLPKPDADSFLGASGYRIAAWIARECSFDGRVSAFDAAGLSAVAALQAGVDDLVTGRSDVALVGAVMPPLDRAFLSGCSGRAQFASGGELYPFDRDACGTVPGEGGAFFVLKRRADALRAHDRIYALVRSVSRDLATIAERDGIPPRSIQLVEASGSGIRAEDAAEVAGITALWGEHKPGDPLVGVGSVKGNIGHCFGAAAAAGLVKAALALRQRVLPPQVPSPHPLEGLSQRSSPVYLLAEARPWLTGDPSAPRRAAVLARSAGADGDRTAAIVLEEEPEDRV